MVVPRWVQTEEKRRPSPASISASGAMPQTMTSRKRKVDSLTPVSSSRPEWAPSRDVFPWSSTAAVYGRCPNVSSRYEKIGRIGEGTYGVVYQAKDKQTGEIVALKRCLPHHEASDGFPITTLREVTILRELHALGGSKHGIIDLREVTVSSSRSGVFLVFEYCEHDLASLIDHYYTQHKSSPFKESEVKRLMIQLLDAIKFLHSKYILHRDLKLSNLLYNAKGEIKVADFGLARRVGGEYVGEKPSAGKAKDDVELTPKVVSLWYRPPELLLGGETYDFAIDNWGVGCIMGELLRGKPLADGKSELDQVQKLFDLLGAPDVDSWPELKIMPALRSIQLPQRRHTTNGKHILDIFQNWRNPAGMKLLMGLLTYNPNRRLTADDALKSSYFSSMPHPCPLTLMPRIPTRHGHERGGEANHATTQADRIRTTET